MENKQSLSSPAGERENIMGTMDINPLLIKLSVPMMVSMLVQALYNVVDSIFVSHVSESALTAVSLAFSLQNVMIAVGVGTGVGVNALLSKSLGEKNQERANQTAENGIFLSLCSYAVFLVIGLTCMKPYFYAQTSDMDIARQGIQYLQLCCVLSLGLFTQTMGEKLLAATGRTHLSMISQLVGAVVNIVLDPIFIFGYCGEALSGTTGAAAATVIGQFCGAGMTLYFNLNKNPDIQISFRGFRPSAKAIGRIYTVGLPSLIGEEFAQELIDYTDKIYLEFGADPHVEGIYTGEDIKEIRKNAIHAGLKLVDCPIRHLGTEKAQQLYLAIQNYLADNGVEMLFSTECENIILENEECKGVLIRGPKDEEAHAVYADTVVIGTGRRGADWLEKICAEHHIAHKPGTVDIGVRVECRNEVMEKVNKVLYESKLIGYPKPWKNKVRTFCQNPGGFVAQENYDNDLAVVNGHSFKEKKSENTNLAILVSHNFTEPFNQPIAYAQKVGELTNMLGAGHIMVQRYGDILDGKRTWQKELAQSNVKPTLKDAVAGDITAAMPYRAMTNIIEFIKMLDMVVPGFAANETLLYSPELKFYSNQVKMDSNLDTNIKGLHCLGDSSGWTRGLMMASVMGVLMGRKLAEKEGC